MENPIARQEDSTRERILNAAEQLFAENSYDGTTLREIAARVGIREPSLYTHYAGKEAIYAAVIDRALLPFSDELFSWSNTPLGLKQIFEIPRKLMELHSRHPYSAQILHREFTSPAHRISPQVLQWQQRFVEQSRAFMQTLPDSVVDSLTKTKVVANMVTLTLVVLGCFSSLGMQSQLLGKEYDQQQLFEEQVKLVTRILKSLLL